MHDVALVEDTARAVGAMLGAMVGNVLGSAVQNDRHYHVARRFPTAKGLSDFWRFDVSQEPVSHGCYTGQSLSGAWGYEDDQVRDACMKSSNVR